MFAVTIGNYRLLCSPDRLPHIYDHYCQQALLVDEINLKDDLLKSDEKGAICCLAFQREMAWPFLIVAQRYFPADYGFDPGILIVPETEIAFIGAGTHLLAYDLKVPRRLWEDEANCGFWRWHRHDGFILMSAELELAAWTIYGEKLWSTFVEPPWDYAVVNGEVQLDVMGKKRTFALERGSK